VQVGTSKAFAFQLKNSGSSALTIRSKQKNAKYFSIGTFPLPLTLQPGNSTQMRVFFKPTVTGKASGTIVLNSTGSNPKMTLSVTGTGVSANGATLGVSPTSLNFGNVTVGNSASLSLTLSAVNGTVNISAAQLNSSEFAVRGLTLPKAIASGQNVTVTVVFTPNASGTASANLVLTSDATNSPTTVPLAGTGVAANAHKADLLWNASKDVVIGYNVYRSGTKGGPYSKVNPVLNGPTSYTDTTVKAGTTYYYVVRGVDSDSHESANSNEASAVIPNP
jgi:hypothetical protein